MLKTLKKIIPKSVFEFFQPAYHYCLALLGAIIYKFPGKKLTVIGVTGTKGKSTTTELVNAILEADGHKTALQNTLRFKIGDKEKRNMFKMTMPGRFFMQKFLRQAVDRGCTHAVIEMSSEGAKQFRHKFLFLDALIFTNLAPEHIESHGSYANYFQAKLDIARELIDHKKKKFTHGPVVVANADDKEGQKFLDLNIINKIPYSLRNTVAMRADEKGSSFQIGKIVIHSKLPGLFNVYNMLGAISYAKFAGIMDEKIKKGLESVEKIRGRMEKISCGQDFDVVVDYAHTPDSLIAAYKTYSPSTSSGPKHKLICVLGNTGGGRDKWKRAEMGKIADKYCDQIILTNEDPYDEDPLEILKEMEKGMKKKPHEIILDRRTAINKAIVLAKEWQTQHQNLVNNKNNKIAVLITGKGTDPYIMEANGTKLPWDDASVAREELQKFLK
jgi:UDP-N-acetylmuramoyl-L-alanyl-D-glutamate--2,6-diaminopimelate ligase